MEVSYHGYLVDFVPHLPFSSERLRWYVRARRSIKENFRIIGAISSLKDAKFILTKKYLDECFKNLKDKNNGTE